MNASCAGFECKPSKLLRTPESRVVPCPAEHRPAQNPTETPSRATKPESTVAGGREQLNGQKVFVNRNAAIY